MEAIGDDGKLTLERVRAISDVETGYTYFRDGDITIAKINSLLRKRKRCPNERATQRDRIRNY